MLWCECARQSIHKVRVKYQRDASKNTDNSLEVLNCRYTKCLDGWGNQDIPGKGVPPEDSSWEERIAADLNASWDNLIFIWMKIYTGGEHWGKVVVIINDNQLVLDPIHQEKARQLSSFLKGVTTEMVNRR